MIHQFRVSFESRQHRRVYIKQLKVVPFPVNVQFFQALNVINHSSLIRIHFANIKNLFRDFCILVIIVFIKLEFILDLFSENYFETKLFRSQKVSNFLLSRTSRTTNPENDHLNKRYFN